MELPGSPSPIILKYEGIFDLDGLYKRIIQFFEEMNYEIHEDTYKGKKDELEVAVKPELKMTEYVKYTPAIKIHIMDMKEIEVVKEGKKVKLTQGRARFELKLSMKFDYSGRFKGHPWAGKLKNFYDKFIFKKEREAYWEDQLYYHLYKLQTIIKEYMDMETKTNAYYNAW